MQLNNLLTLSTVVLVGLIPPKATAQTWQTVFDFQLAAGSGGAGGNGLVADARGNVFLVGTCADASGVSHGIVLKTDTTQTNWDFSDDNNPSVAQYNSSLGDLGFDAMGNLYSIGQLTPKSSGNAYWYVRRSSDGGVSWSTVDLYQYAAGQWANSRGFAADDLGNIYVVGWGQDASRTHDNHWLVRRSRDAGKTWSVVDDVKGIRASEAVFVPGAGIFVAGDASGAGWIVRRSQDGGSTWSTVDNPFAGGAEAMGTDSNGNVYVSGMKNSNSSTTAWVTRVSRDGGRTWTTIDSFSYAPNKSAGAWGVAKTVSGNIAVAGRGTDSQGKLHWLVRTPDASGTWQTIENFQLSPAYNASGLGIASDAAGNLLVNGFAYDAAGDHWVVRRLALR